MARVILGLQGSGKSAYAVNLMLNSLQEFDRIYSNIEDLKPYENIVPYDLQEFFEIFVPRLYQKYKQEKASDLDLIDEIKKYFNVEHIEDFKFMLVVDEAHNYFGKNNDWLTWYVTYHRHLYCELIFITQNYKLLATNYHIITDVVEIFSPKLQFNKKKIKFKKFIGMPPNKANFFENGTIDKKSILFNMYKSGDKVRTESFLWKYILLLIVGLIIVVFAFKHLIFNLGGSGRSVPVPKKIEIKEIADNRQSVKNREIREEKDNEPIQSKSIEFDINEGDYMVTTLSIVNNNIDIYGTFVKNLDLSEFELLKSVLSFKVLKKKEENYRDLFFISFDKQRLELLRDWFELPNRDINEDIEQGEEQTKNKTVALN